MTPPKFCRDCRHYLVTNAENNLGDCTRRWHDLVTGEQDIKYDLPAWEARKRFCGLTGEGWEAKTAPAESAP